MRSFLSLPSVALASLAGCLPAVLVDRPAITGQVVGADGRPAAATVHISRTDDPASIVDHVPTRADGRFCRPAEGGRWFIYFLPQDNPPPPTFRVNAVSPAGMSSATIVTGGQIKPFGLGPDRSVDIGLLRLE